MNRNPKKPLRKSRIRLWRYPIIPSSISLVKRLEMKNNKRWRYKNVDVKSAYQSLSTPTMTWRQTSWTFSNFGSFSTSSSMLCLQLLMLVIGLLFSWLSILYSWSNLLVTCCFPDQRSISKNWECTQKLFASYLIYIKLIPSSKSIHIHNKPLIKMWITCWDTLMSLFSSEDSSSSSSFTNSKKWELSSKPSWTL